MAKDILIWKSFKTKYIRLLYSSFFTTQFQQQKPDKLPMKILVTIACSLLIFHCAAADNLATLSALYPEQSKEFIKTRVANSKNVHKFYRSFVRYYYSVMKKNPSLITELDSLKNYKGVVSGDPHVENFGFLVDKDHKAHFGFNDFDDADNSVLSLDLLRHFASALLVKPNLSVDTYFKTYKQALGIKLKSFPETLAEMKRKAEKKGHRLSEDDVDIDGKTFLKYKKVVLKMSDEETTIVQKKLQTLLQKEIDSSVIVHEIYKRTKDSGGSAGLVRFQILLSIKGKLQWLELKELTVPATVYYYAIKTRIKNDRLELIKNHLLPAEVKDEFSLVNFQGKSYMAAYIWDGEIGLDFQEIDESAWEEIILLEVKFLGYLHGKTLNKKQAAYKDAIGRLPSEDWKSAALKVIQKITETYHNVKN